MSINALGLCEDDFDPTNPGRLCRGRERWIESYSAEEVPRVRRTVVSGAVFTDDSAYDARRGIHYSGLDVGQVLECLYDGATLYAWAEEAPTDLIPEDATAIEEYQVRRPGSSLERWKCRWTLVCSTAQDIERAIAAGADVFVTLSSDAKEVPLLGPESDTRAMLIAELAPLADTPDIEESPICAGIRQRLYLMTGFRNADTAMRFQSVVIPELLEHVASLVLIHRDKHGACLGIYTMTPFEHTDRLRTLCRQREILLVPFAIPPMLARWDRALWELRRDWDEAAQGGPFPVDVAPMGSPSWGRRVPDRGATFRTQPPEEKRQQPQEQADQAQEETTEPTTEQGPASKPMLSRRLR